MAAASGALRRLAELVRDTLRCQAPWTDPIDDGEIIARILHTSHSALAHLLAKVYEQPATPATDRRPSVLQALQGEAEPIPCEEPFEIEVKGLNDPDSPRFFLQAIFGLQVSGSTRMVS